MSRSGYVDDWDFDPLEMGRWRGAVNSAIKGKRGQKLLKELKFGLESLKEKELISGELKADGMFCSLGIVGEKRNIDMSDIDPEDSEVVAKRFDIADALAREIVFYNDEAFTSQNDERGRKQRYKCMLDWVDSKIVKD